MMDKGFTVLVISEVKKTALNGEPLHQALLQKCNKKSESIHTQNLKPPIRCYLQYSEPCCECEE
jgi:CRISPR/Cas system type I-B associated protein Csh2 (Cas7 group RAMP superfamily)